MKNFALHNLSVVAVSLLAPILTAGATHHEPCMPPPGTTLVQFRSGTNTLRGFIDLPQGSGKHPAILIVHGARPTDVTVQTDYFSEMRSAFRHAGIATFIWDKAGNGCSSGRYSSELPIRERATEALAALRAISDRDDIDSSRIGIWAHSQGGWIAPMAAVRSSAIGYLIIVSGPGRDAASQGSYLVRNLLREAGLNKKEDQKAYTALGRAAAIAFAGADGQELSDALKPLQNYSALGRPGLPDLTNTAFLKQFQTDPQWSLSADVFLQQVRVPTLAIFGGRDTQVDWRESMEVYRSAFARGGNYDLTIRTFKEADHDMLPPRNEKRLSDSMFVDGYVQAMVDWLQSHNFTAKNVE